MEGQRKRQSEGLFAYFPKISKESETVVDSSLSGADAASKGSIQSCPDEELIDSMQSFSDAEQGIHDSENEHEGNDPLQCTTSEYTYIYYQISIL